MQLCPSLEIPFPMDNLLLSDGSVKCHLVNPENSMMQLSSSFSADNANTEVVWIRVWQMCQIWFGLSSTSQLVHPHHPQSHTHTSQPLSHFADKQRELIILHMPVNIWLGCGLVVAAMQAAFPNISSSTPPPSRFLLFKIGRRMLCDTCVCSTCLPPAHLLLLFLLPRPHHFHSVHRFTQLVFHTYFSIY